MTLRSRRGEATNPQHLQIRSLWQDAAPRPAVAPHPMPATSFAPRGRSIRSEQHTARPVGLPAFTYTPGQPSPRIAGQHWEEQFRLKLVAAVKRRKRRAHLSIVLAGSGVLLVAAFFATLISLQYPDRELTGAEVADASAITATPDRALADRALYASLASTSVSSPKSSANLAVNTRFAALDVSASHQDFLTTPASARATVPVRTLTADADLRSEASIDAPHVTRTRLRIVGDQISDPGAMIMARGFPEGVSLSDGMSPKPGTWVLGLESTRNLSIIAPAHFRGAFRAYIEVIATGGVSLGQHEVEINLPASAIVIAMPTLKSIHRPRALPQKNAQEQQALAPSSRERAPSASDPKAVLAAPQLAAEDAASAASASPAAADQRRAFQPAYGLGGPR
jgi:hypothetical protein